MYLGFGNVRITNVNEGMAADRAGIQVDDVILSVNEWEITSFVVLQDIIDVFSPGDRAEIRVLRGGSELVLSAIFDPV